MLKRLCGISILLISLCFVIDGTKKEVKTIFVYEQEKAKLEKEVEITKLEIPEWNFERLVKKGDVSHIDSLFATQLIGNKNNIVIAGHDIPTVFRPLQNIQVGTRIRLIKGNKIIEYIVFRILRVKPTEVRYLEETSEEQLTLITCTENDQKRLIVICNKNNIS